MIFVFFSSGGVEWYGTIRRLGSPRRLKAVLLKNSADIIVSMAPCKKGTGKRTGVQKQQPCVTTRPKGNFVIRTNVKRSCIPERPKSRRSRRKIPGSLVATVTAGVAERSL